VARVRITRWNAEALLGLVPQVLQAYGEQVAPQLQDSLKAVRYEWPLTTDQGGDIVTYRNNGERVRSPRNIFDTGELARSQTPPQVTSNSMRIAWTAPYSGEVLRGGYIVSRRNGNYIAPGRDWITPVVQATPPEKFFVEEWRRLAQGQ